MKKIKLLLILLLIPIGLFIKIDFAKGVSCDLIFFKTNKSIYFIDESIRINASWDLNYNINNEYAYVEVQIFNNFDLLLWNTSKYDMIGTYEKNWTLFIQDLNLDFTNSSNVIYVKFFYYSFKEDIGIPQGEFLGIIEITISKKEVSCELIGIRENLRYSEDLSFKARFFDSSSFNISNLINQEIWFEIFSNNSLIYQINYTTNQNGIIEVLISSINHLRFGYNTLKFKILNNKIYENTEFVYEILLEKNVIFIDVIDIKFTEILKKNENIEIKLFFYYFFNNTIEPLNESIIVMRIFCNKFLTFMNEYKTDKNGILSIIISQESFNSEEKSEYIIIDFIFNGNYFLENKSVSLNLKINSFFNSKSDSYSYLSIISLLMILILILIVLPLIFKNIKKNRETILEEIIFRY